MNYDELINGLRKRDRKTQEETYKAFNSAITNIVKEYIFLQEDVEEIVQDVFVKAFRKIDQFDGRSNMKTWLTKIAINSSKNFLDSIKNNNEITNKEIDIYESFQWPSNLLNPEDLIINKEGRSILIKATKILSEKQRAAFLWFYVEELSQLEISEIMGVSIDAVESLIHRAKTKFKTIIELKSKAQ